MSRPAPRRRRPRAPQRPVELNWDRSLRSVRPVVLRANRVHCQGHWKSRGMNITKRVATCALRIRSAQSVSCNKVQSSTARGDLSRFRGLPSSTFPRGRGRTGRSGSRCCAGLQGSRWGRQTEGLRLAFSCPPGSGVAGYGQGHGMMGPGVTVSYLYFCESKNKLYPSACSPCQPVSTCHAGTCPSQSEHFVSAGSPAFGPWHIPHTTGFIC